MTVRHEIQAQRRAVTIIRWGDFAVLVGLLAFLALTILFAGRANIQSDAIDYYAILQRITGRPGKPIVKNLHFVEQRSPGYPLISAAPYCLIAVALEPFVPTQAIVEPSPDPGRPPPRAESERFLVPDQPLLAKDIFFKNFYIASQDSWFEWPLILALLSTSYAMLFAGIALVVKTLALEGRGVLGACLVPLTIVTSIVFVHNAVNTPAYATLTAFGASAVFGYFFVQGLLRPGALAHFLAGLSLGFLVLIRLETLVILGVILLFLIVAREWAFLVRSGAGSALAPGVLLLYNLAQFGDPFHVGILRGDINQIVVNGEYIFANLFHPQSGIVFWSPLVALGLIGLFIGRQKHLLALGVSSLALIGLILIRVPVMYNHIGGGPIEIGGLLVACPRDTAEMLTLVRSDANRYIAVLIPFAVLGLRNLFVPLIQLARRLRPSASEI